MNMTLMNRICRTGIAAAVFFSISACVEDETPQQREEVARLQSELQQTQESMRAEVKGQFEASEAARTRLQNLQKEIADLRQDEERTRSDISDRKAEARDAQRVINETKDPGDVGQPYDTVVFKSGRTVKCRVVEYHNGELRLEDHSGKTIITTPGSLAGVRFRTEPTSDAFPRQTKNTRAKPTPTPKDPGKFKIAEHMLRIYTVRNKAKRKTNVIAGYIDERKQDVKYKVKVESKALPADAHGLHASLWVFAEGVSNRNGPLKLIILKEHKFDLPRLGSIEFETNEVTLEYDEKGGARYGFKYYGYVLEIKDSDGRTVVVKRSNKKLQDNLDQIRNLSIDEEIRL